MTWREYYQERIARHDAVDRGGGEKQDPVSASYIKVRTDEEDIDSILSTAALIHGTDIVVTRLTLTSS